MGPERRFQSPGPKVYSGGPWDDEETKTVLKIHADRCRVERWVVIQLLIQGGQSPDERRGKAPQVVRMLTNGDGPAM